MKFCIAFLPLIISHICLAQADSSKWSHAAPLSLYIEPSGLISLYHNSSLRAGLEVPIGKKAGLNVTGLYYGEGFGFKAAGKKYFPSQIIQNRRRKAFGRARSQAYLAAEIFYKSYSYKNKDSLKGVGDLEYEVAKSAWTLSLICGEVNTLQCGIYYEWFAGLGVRLKTVGNNLTPAEQSNLYHWHEGFVASFTDANAFQRIGPHIALGIRVGYLLNPR